MLAPDLATRDPVSRLIYELSRLPGVGEKTATRLAYHILKQGRDTTEALANAIRDAKSRVVPCSRCFYFTESEICQFCADSRRDAGVICVVERPSDLMAIERTGAHRGLYHVLHGVLSPMDGIGPEELRIAELLQRLVSVREVILALNPSVEGEATALYLSKLLKPSGIKTTRLAYGLPVGGTLEYADRQTIGRALDNRVEVA